MTRSNFMIQVSIKKYVYDDAKSNHFSVELHAGSGTTVYGSFKTYKAAMKFAEKFSLKKPGKNSKKVTVTDFRDYPTFEETIKKNAA